MFVTLASGSLALESWVDEDHPELLKLALGSLLNASNNQMQQGSTSGVPKFAFQTLKRGGGKDGLGTGNGTDLSRPAPYISPAFETRISALHALEALGRTSPVCRDSALLLLLVAHGPDANRAATIPSRPASGEDDEPPARAPLRRPAEAAVKSIAASLRLSSSGLLRRQDQQLLAMWLQLELNIRRLPCALFGASGITADDALRAFVSQSRMPLSTAAAMASNAPVLTTAAQVLQLGGGAADLLLEALPHVLARLLTMAGSQDDAEREASTRGMDFVSSQLSPRTLLAAAAPRLPELIASLLRCATSIEPPHPPKRSISHILRVLGASSDARATLDMDKVSKGAARAPATSGFDPAALPCATNPSPDQ